MSSNRLQYYNDPEESMSQVLDGRQAQIWTAIPAIVTSVNLTAMTIEAQPAIQGINVDINGVQSFVSLPLVVDVPICFPSAGGFTITFPIAINDEVLVVFSSRCIDGWFQSGCPVVNGIVVTQQPMELRMHDLSDGFAIFGPKSQPKVIGSISSTDLQMRNNPGTALIGMTPAGGIYFTPASGQHVTVNGSLVASGEVTAGITSIPLSAHVHNGVSTGTSNTGGPLP